MATVYANNVVEIAVIQTYAGRPAVNVWHMEATEEWWPASITDIVRDFANNWQDHVLSMQTPSTTLERFEYRSLDIGNGDVGTLAPDSGKPTVGSFGSNGAPPNVAYLIKKNTDNRPRGARDGRMFLVGVEETVVDPAGIVDATNLNALQGLIDDFYNGISDTGVFTNDGRFPVVLETTPASRAPGTQPVTVNSRRITSLTVDRMVSTQRDRLR